jgi:hypothetical protein
MPKLSTPHHGLEGLFDLDRKGVDIRPTLLRVLTDQFLQSPVHTPDDVRHYTELAIRLLDETDIATRAAVSVRLAPHACAPRPIMLQLARDVLDVAEPVLLHSPVLTPDDCATIIEERGVSYAEILSRRGRPTPTVAPAPAPSLEPVPEPAPAPQAFTPPTTATPAETAPIVEHASEAPAAEPTAESEPERKPEPVSDPAARELCELFFAAGSAERRLILLNLDYADWPTSEPPAPLQRADVWRLETAALRHHSMTLMRELERALGVSDQQSRRIVEDELGEPIVVAGKAMSMPADVLQRIVLFMNPRVGQSVNRVYELSALYNEISIEAARRLISILRAAEPMSQKHRDARSIHAAAETGRRALSDLASTVIRRPETVQRRAAAAGEN